MKLSILLLITTLILMQAYCANQTIFVAQLTSEGARSNIGPNPVEKEWEYGEGEITSMGLRQHYLVGYDLRVNYAEKLDLERKNDPKQGPLPIYSPWQVNIRSTNDNYTLMSAQAGLEALYPPEAREDLTVDQAKIAEPPGDNSTIIDDIKSLGNKIMPKNFQTLPIHAMDFNKDTVLLSEWCAEIQEKNKEAVMQKTFIEQTSQKYEVALNGFKDAIGKNNISLHEIYEYMDGLYTAEFNRDSIGDLEKYYEDLMKFRTEYYNQYWSNDQSRRIFANGFVKDLERYLNDAVEQYESTVLDNYNKIKLSLYYGRLDSAYVISREFGYNHTEGPLFSSQLLIELTRDENNYYVSVLFNKQPIKLSNQCKESTICTLSDFTSLLESMKASESQLSNCVPFSEGGYSLYSQNESSFSNTRLILSLGLLVLSTVVALVVFAIYMLRNKITKRQYQIVFSDQEELKLVI